MRTTTVTVSNRNVVQCLTTRGIQVFIDALALIVELESSDTTHPPDVFYLYLLDAPTEFYH